MKKFILTSIISLLIGFLLGGLLFYHCGKKVPQIEEKEIIIQDTIFQDKIIEKTKLKYITTLDTIIEYKLDTITIKDTIYIPIEHLQYLDTFITDTTQLRLRIKYSGFKAQLDTIEYNLSYKPKTPLKSKKKGQLGQFIGLGLGVNYGLCINPYKTSFQPNISVGVVYGFGYNW